MQFVSGRVIDAQAVPSAAQSYQMLFGVYAIALAMALIIYLISRDAPPNVSTGK